MSITDFSDISTKGNILKQYLVRSFFFTALVHIWGMKINITFGVVSREILEIAGCVNCGFHFFKDGIYLDKWIGKKFLRLKTNSKVKQFSFYAYCKNVYRS